MGGAGIIFKARHKNIPNKELVVKFNRPFSQHDLSIIDGKPISLVENESKILPLLNNSNIIPTIDIGKIDVTLDDDQRPLSFIIEPYVADTVTLPDYVNSLTLNDAVKVTPTMIDNSIISLISLLRQWVDALAYIHDMGFLYLDLKPDNAIVDKEGHLIAIDFGSAMKIDLEDERSVEVFVTRRFAEPRLKEKMIDKHSSNRVRCGIKRKELTYDLDFYALGKSIMELLQIISKTHGHDFPQRPLFRSIHFLATRLLNGKNQSRRASYDDTEEFLSEIFAGLEPSDYKTIHYNNLEEVLVDLKKEQGSWNPERIIPELDTYSKDVVRIVPHINTVLTKRLKKLIEHPLVARLQLISQLGLVTLVYPTAGHSRYEHVIGAYTYTSSYVKSLFNDFQNPIFRNLVDEQYIKAVLLAALFHDLGQYPLAHDLAEVQPKIFNHSSISLELLEYPMRNEKGETLLDIIKKDWNVDINCVKRILGTHSGQFPSLVEERDFKADMLSALIDGPIDADKADYITRDSIQCRIPYGRQLDFERLFRVLTTIRIRDGYQVKHKVTIGVYEKGRASAASFSLARYLLYSSVYWHHTSRILKAMLQYATTLLLPEEVFNYNNDEKCKEIRAKMIDYIINLVPPFTQSFNNNLPIKPPEEKKADLDSRPPTDVSKTLFSSTTVVPKKNTIPESWFPGISWTDWLMLNWLANLSYNSRGINLIEHIQKRKLYKRVFTIPRNDHNIEFIEKLDRLAWPNRVKLSEKIAQEVKELIERRGPKVKTPSVKYGDDVDTIFSENLTILVDIPNLARITKERPLIYMPELERKTYYPQSQSPIEAQRLDKSQKSLMESVSPVRVLCHPELRQLLHVCIKPSEINSIVECALSVL